MKKPFDTWNIVGVFNWSGEKMLKELEFQSLDLQPEVSYLVHDFWQDEFLGSFQEFLSLEVPPQSCQVLAIHKRVPNPQFLSSSRHITQGGVELERLDWDDSAQTLSGVCKVIKDNPYDLSIHVPGEFRPVRVFGAEGDEYGHNEIFRLKFSSTETKEIPWQVGFDKT